VFSSDFRILFGNLAVVTFLMVGLSACQPVPAPFAHPSGTGDPSVANRPDIAGVTVNPIAGLTKIQSDALSRAVADAFIKLEIPAATSGANKRSQFLEGFAFTDGTSRDRTGVRILWRLTDSQGNLIGKYQSSKFLGRGNLKNPTPENYSDTAKRTARHFARLILRTRLEGVAAPISALPPLHVWPVDGIDEDRSAVLKSAMEQTLKFRKFPVLKGLDGAALIITGAVSLGPVRQGRQPITISWAVLNASGKQLGKLDQKNAVSVSTIKNNWQLLSQVIAKNAAGGVSEIVNRLPLNSFPQDKKTR
tara:strand:- start:47 stop:964 length:918 start_codon:yes stop_codon:yes gene_type:complete